MPDAAFFRQFAHEWIEAWNRHDLEAILAHYADDFEMNSPFIVQIAGEPSGRLRGKLAVGQYWEKALARVPDLRFELITVLDGAQSLTLYYRHHTGRLAAEVFHFNADRQVQQAFAHYALPEGNL